MAYLVAAVEASAGQQNVIIHHFDVVRRKSNHLKISGSLEARIHKTDNVVSSDLLDYHSLAVVRVHKDSFVDHFHYVKLCVKNY